MKKAFYLTMFLVSAFLVGVAYTQADQPTPMATPAAKATKAKKTKKAAKPASAEADGSSFEKAILIKDKTEGPGEDSEYAWIAAHYPDYKTNLQTLNQHGDRPYDIISITTKDGQKKDIFFDISNFFGKF